MSPQPYLKHRNFTNCKCGPKGVRESRFTSPSLLVMHSVCVTEKATLWCGLRATVGQLCSSTQARQQLGDWKTVSGVWQRSGVGDGGRIFGCGAEWVGYEGGGVMWGDSRGMTGVG